MRAARLPSFAVVPALFVAASALQDAVGQPVSLKLLARVGDAFPGRPGYVYNDIAPFLGERFVDVSGDIYFPARSKNGAGAQADDLLVYRRASGVVEPYVRAGDQIGGFDSRVFWGAVGGYQAGVLGHVALLNDPVLGERFAVIVSRPDGSRTVAARDLDQPPGYPLDAGLTNIGTTSGAALDVNMNSTGVVSYGGRFLDQNNVQRYGYYLTRPGGQPERIVDSTMPVPGHPGAEWTASDNIGVPFDGQTPGLDAAGNAYFRAKYVESGKEYRAFYKRTADGSISPITDAAATGQVPGLAGHTFHRIRTATNNQPGDIAFGAEVNKPDGTFFGSGVYAGRAGQPIKKILSSGDAVPGIPEAVNHSPGLIAMNDSSHLLITDNYFLNGFGGQSLLLYNPDGTAETVLKFNETPGFPGQRAGLTTAAALNSSGDAVFITRMNISTTTLAAFVYLNDTNTLVPVLKTGDVLGGKTVVTFSLGSDSPDPLGAIGPSGGPSAFDDARRLSLAVILKDAAGQQSEALYAVQVPAPGAALSLLFGLVYRRSRRSGG